MKKIKSILLATLCSAFLTGCNFDLGFFKVSDAGSSNGTKIETNNGEVNNGGSQQGGQESGGNQQAGGEITLAQLEAQAISFYKSFTGNSTYKIGDYSSEDDYYSMDFLKNSDTVVFYDIYCEDETANKTSSWLSKFLSIVSSPTMSYKDEDDDGSEYVFRYYDKGGYTYIVYGLGYDDAEYGTFSMFEITILRTADVDTYDAWVEQQVGDLDDDDYEDIDWDNLTDEEWEALLAELGY